MNRNPPKTMKKVLVRETADGQEMRLLLYNITTIARSRFCGHKNKLSLNSNGNESTCTIQSGSRRNQVRKCDAVLPTENTGCRAPRGRDCAGDFVDGGNCETRVFKMSEFVLQNDQGDFFLEWSFCVRGRKLESNFHFTSHLCCARKFERPLAEAFLLLLAWKGFAVRMYEPEEKIVCYVRFRAFPRPGRRKATEMIVLKVALEVLGAIVVVYFGVGVIATVGDVGQRTRRWL